MARKQKVMLFFATGATSGNAPYAPGTIGTAAGLPLCFILSRFHPAVSVAGAFLFILFAIWVSNRAEKILGQKDPGCIVIDEMAGIIVTLLGLSLNGEIILGGFLLFRFFDILKPFPIRYIEKKISGGVGIVLDDVVAGIFAHVVLRMAMFFF